MTAEWRGLWHPSPRRDGWTQLWLRAVIYAVTPLALALVFGEVRGLREFATGYLGSFIVGASICASGEILYGLVWPRIVRRDVGLAARIAGHAITIVVAVSVGVAIAAQLGAILLGWPDVMVKVWLQGMVISIAMITTLVVVDEISARGRALERREAEQRVAVVRAELSALQARTDPQFLFDTLGSVAALIATDPALAELQLERLAAVFRYSLDATRRDSVELADEIEAATAYLEAQGVRLGGLRWTVDREPGIDALRVPPLVLQPLIEDAIRRGAGDVAVSARRRGDALVLAVAANTACTAEVLAELRTRLAHTGATLEAAADGAELVIPSIT